MLTLSFLDSFQFVLDPGKLQARGIDRAFETMRLLQPYQLVCFIFHMNCCCCGYLGGYLKSVSPLYPFFWDDQSILHQGVIFPILQSFFFNFPPFKCHFLTGPCYLDWPRVSTGHS